MRASGHFRSRRACPWSMAEFKYAFFCAFFLVTLASCSVTFLSSYDEVTDRAISDLTTRTEAFLSRYAAVTDESGHAVRAGKHYDTEAAAFYDEARGAVASILLRSREKAKNEDEISVLTNLEGRYRRLEESHRLGPITQTSASGLLTSLRAVTHIQLTKKRIGTTTQPASAP